MTFRVKAVALGLALAALTSSADAQRLADTRMAVAPSAAPADATMVQAAGEKNAVVAGVLSWIVPGLGSFYAGNSRHGAIHLGLHVVFFGVMIAGIGSAFEDCLTSTDPTCGTGGAGTFYAGFVGTLVNGVWSIFTAVKDANTANKPAGAARDADFSFAPAVTNLRSVQVLPNSTPEHRLGVQVLRLAY